MIQSKLTMADKEAYQHVVDGGRDVLERVVLFFENAVYNALGVPNTGVRVRGQKAREAKPATKKRKAQRARKPVPGFTYYPNPSAPGEPPHKITGQLRGGIMHEFSADGLTARVGLNPSVKYGIWLEFGIPGGRTILPKTKKVLRFVTKDGKVVFARRVKQGAIKARSFLASTLKKVLPQLKALAEQ